MRSPPIVAIEGLPFVGKTSGLLAALERLPQWVAVEEYHDLLDQADVSEYAIKPGSTSSQADRIDTYIALDLLRWSKATAARAAGTPVVLDRYHLSIITYSRALYDCFGLGDPTDVADRYQRAVADPACPIACPDVVIFAEVNCDTALDRLTTHSTTIGTDFTSPDFVDRLIAHYDTATTSTLAHMHRIDANKPIDHVHERIHQILSSHS